MRINDFAIRRIRSRLQLRDAGSTRNREPRRRCGGYGASVASADRLAVPPSRSGVLLADRLPLAARSTTPAAVPPPAQMVMISLGDLGFKASVIHARVGGQVMFMVVNRGRRPHSVASTIPVTHVTLDDPSGNSASTSASGFTVTVPVGGELDVSLIATRTGNFPLVVDGAAAGSLIVG